MRFRFSRERLYFCERQRKHVTRVEYVPATLAWKFAKQVVVMCEFLNAETGSWVDACATNATAEQRRATLSKKPNKASVRDKLEPFSRFCAIPACGTEPRYDLKVNDAVAWFLHTSTPQAQVQGQSCDAYRTMCTLLRGPLAGPYYNGPNETFEEMFRTMQQSRRESARSMPGGLCNQMFTDVSLAFKITKSSAQLAKSKRGKAPMRMRLDFVLSKATESCKELVHSVTQEQSFFCFHQDMCEENRKRQQEHDKRQRELAKQPRV